MLRVCYYYYKLHNILKQTFLDIIKQHTICNPTDADFEAIKHFIKQFELDDRDLQHSQFLVGKDDDGLLGFGRIRIRENCSELCSLGVLEPKRMQGIGKLLVKKLILKSEQPLYLVCIIPNFFNPFGFKIVSEYPEAIKEKLDYCTSELIVPEPYVVMKYF